MIDLTCTILMIVTIVIAIMLYVASLDSDL